MKLSAATKKRITQLHGRSVKRAMRAEDFALKAMRDVVRGASAVLLDDVIAAVTRSTGSESVALSAVYKATQRIDEQFFNATVSARSTARAFAQDQLGDELLDVVGYVQELEKLGPLAANEAAPLLRPAPNGPELDVVRARAAAGSMSSRLAAAATHELAEWKRRAEDAGKLPTRFRTLAGTVDGTVRKHAASQAFDAYADEKAGFWRDAAGPPDDPDEPYLPYGWRGVTYDVWSAILDRRTCPVCGTELDGRLVPVGKQFPIAGRPPAHGFCRCVVVTMVIPEAARKKLPGITADYQALKEDVSEYVRGSRLAHHGKRHAASFIGEAVATSGPQALTRRMSERAYVDFPKRNVPKLPTLPGL